MNDGRHEEYEISGVILPENDLQEQIYLPNGSRAGVSHRRDSTAKADLEERRWRGRFLKTAEWKMAEARLGRTAIGARYHHQIRPQFSQQVSYR